MRTNHPDLQDRFATGDRIFFLVLLLLIAVALTGKETRKTRFSLEDCVEAALQHNPLLRVSRLGVEESRTRIDTARAGYLPTVSLEASGRSSTLDADSDSERVSSSDHYSGGISMQYPVFQGGRTVAAVRAARAALTADQARHQSGEADLVINVTAAYYRLLQAERLVATAEQSYLRAGMHLDFAEARFNAGLARRADVLKARVARADAALSLIRARNAHLGFQGQLNLEMGRSADEPLAIVDDLEAVADSGDQELIRDDGTFAKYREAAFARRPELAQIEAQLNAQQANIRLARSDYYPTLALFAGYGFDGLSLAAMKHSGHIGLSLSYTVFDGFARPARVRLEKLAYSGLEAQREGLQRQIGLEVWNAFLQVKEATERIASARVFFANALENRDIAEGEYREGVGSMLDVTDAQTMFVSAEQTLIEALADYRIARAVLDRAVGIRTTEETESE